MKKSSVVISVWCCLFRPPFDLSKFWIWLFVFCRLSTFYKKLDWLDWLWLTVAFRLEIEKPQVDLEVFQVWIWDSLFAYGVPICLHSRDYINQQVRWLFSQTRLCCTRGNRWKFENIGVPHWKFLRVNNWLQVGERFKAKDGARQQKTCSWASLCVATSQKSFCALKNQWLIINHHHFENLS